MWRGANALKINVKFVPTLLTKLLQKYYFKISTFFRRQFSAKVDSLKSTYFDFPYTPPEFGYILPGHPDSSVKLIKSFSYKKKSLYFLNKCTKMFCGLGCWQNESLISSQQSQGWQDSEQYQQKVQRRQCTG